MKIEEKFNKRCAELIEVQLPSIRTGRDAALGMCLEFFTIPGSNDLRTISIHLTKDEALRLAESLIKYSRVAV